MNKKKKETYKRLTILIITSILIFTSIQISVISLSNDANISEYKNPRCVFKRIETLKPQIITERDGSNQNNLFGVTGTDTWIYGDGTLEICQNPTITDDGGQNTLVGFELWPDWITFPDAYFRYSTDGGTSWLPEDSATGWAFAEVGYITILPDIDYNGENGAFGTVLPIDQNNWITMNFPDMTDPEAVDAEWEASGWLADVMMSEWHSADVCGVSSGFAPSEYAYGLAVWTGDTVDDGTNGLWFGWEQAEGTEFVVYPDEEDPGYDFEADQAVNDVDLSTGKYYQAFLRFDDVGADPLPDGVFLRSVQLDGTADWVDSWTTLEHIPGATNPDIKADGGNCYLTYEQNGGISCLYSNDNGGNFQSVPVVNNGQYPKISAVDETVVIVYTRDGNVYNSISEDGGATWVESDVNDDSGSAVEQIGCVDVSSSNIVWTDNRENQNTVYFDKAEVAIPIIEIESISGGFGVSAVITNTGTADATNIDWSITFEGGVFIGNEKTGTISILSPGDTETISSGFVFGLGGTDIAISAGSARSEVSGTVLLFFVIGL